MSKCQATEDIPHPISKKRNTTQEDVFYTAAEKQWKIRKCRQ